MASPDCGFCPTNAESSSSSSSSSSSRSVLLSGGDGQGEHPSQAILDLFSIAELNPQWFSAVAKAALGEETETRDRISNISNKQLTIAFIGDLRYGR